jgi:hypothetical protein
MAKRLGVAALCSVAVLMGASVAFGQIKAHRAAADGRVHTGKRGHHRQG